jgi:hypothetical protein
MPTHPLTPRHFAIGSKMRLRAHRLRRRIARGDQPGGSSRFTRDQGAHVAVGFQRNVGLLLLAIWLILYGISGMVALGLPSPLMAVLALLAGILILVGR